MYLSKSLQSLGMDRKQAKVYLACLEFGMAKASDISKKTKLERSTTYDVLDKLTKEGLVSFFNKKGVKYFMAENPENIKKKLEEKQKTIETVLPELKSIFSTAGAKPKIKYYEGVEGIKTVLLDTLSTKDKKLFGILSMADLFELLGQGFVDKYVAKRIESGIFLKVLRTKSKDVNDKWNKEQEDLRELRFVPKEMTFDMTMYMYDNKLVLVSSKKESFGMIIESKELSNNMKNLFTALWQIS